MNTSFGLLSLCVAIISYVLYFRDTIAHRTKPHSITWFIWGTLNSFIFYQQITHDAGPGAWVTGLAAIADSLICLYSLRSSRQRITQLDWWCLALAGVSVGLWLYTSDPHLAVILASVTFGIGFIPTFRKSHTKPHEETLISFALNGAKFFIALFALDTFTITTALYPFALFVLNMTFVVFLLARRPHADRSTPA